ncbi:hypothetical protein TESS_TESS_02213 [Tessaracoccus sp. O5.2]|uniref:hypothetical protein n=1 Tax=Tessaracoccus sp. O5.2 TaxID=3157622 RepID=UPI0035E95A4F
MTRATPPPHGTSGRLLRDIANVVNLSTPLGLIIAAATRSRIRRRGGLIVADRARLPLRNAAAFTVGSVVILPHRELEEAERRNPSLMEHEDAHAWQYAYCLGLPFIPLYFMALAWSVLRTGDRASANHFERQADLAKGGYPAHPILPVREGIRRLMRGEVRL